MQCEPGVSFSLQIVKMKKGWNLIEKTTVLLYLLSWAFFCPYLETCIFSGLYVGVKMHPTKNTLCDCESFSWFVLVHERYQNLCVFSKI